MRQTLDQPRVFGSFYSLSHEFSHDASQIDLRLWTLIFALMLLSDSRKLSDQCRSATS
jgi:hypothetical protein